MQKAGGIAIVTREPDGRKLPATPAGHASAAQRAPPQKGSGPGQRRRLTGTAGACDLRRGALIKREGNLAELYYAPVTATICPQAALPREFADASMNRNSGSLLEPCADEM